MPGIDRIGDRDRDTMVGGRRPIENNRGYGLGISLLVSTSLF